MRIAFKRILTGAAIVLFATQIFCSQNAMAEGELRKPNIVFFLVDDLGWPDVGCYGSSFYETPAIDQLAKEGVLFNNAYSTCHVCSPSRASILTGKYPARTNLTDWGEGRPERDYEKLHSGERVSRLPVDEQTLAETLRRHGYATANYGKTHVGRDPKTFGFDEAIAGWVTSYYYPFGKAYDKTLPAKEGDYFTDKLTDVALDFIERKKDQPFFVHMEHFAVHDPIQGRRDLVAKYQKKLDAMPRSEGPNHIVEGNPDDPELTEEELEAIVANKSHALCKEKRAWWVSQKQENFEYAALVESMDESLARIRAKLKALGLEENTIIVFTSDNGGLAATREVSLDKIINSTKQLNQRFATSNLPLRGGKGWNYEGGLRVPLIMSWPGRIKANSINHEVVTGTDYYPTLLELLGLPSLPEQHMDGKSFAPALRGEDYDRGAIYWHFPHYSNHGWQSPSGAIRLGNYKLIEYFENGTVQLFDLDNDLGEQRDLSKENPEVTQRLLKMLQDWRQETDAKMPYPKTATSKLAPGSRVYKPRKR